MNTDLWEVVLEKAKQRQAKGLSEYGKPVTADETVDWIEHAIEEQLDSAVYLEAVKQVIVGLKEKIVQLDVDKFHLTERNKALLTECAEWEKFSKEMEASLTQMMDQREHLIEDQDAAIDLLKKEVALWKQKEAEAQEQLKTAEAVANTTKFALALANSDVERLKQTEKVLTEQADTLKVELEDAKEEVDRLHSELKTAEKGNHRLLTAISKYQQTDITLPLLGVFCGLVSGLAVGYLLF